MSSVFLIKSQTDVRFLITTYISYSFLKNYTIWQNETQSTWQQLSPAARPFGEACIVQ